MALFASETLAWLAGDQPPQELAHWLEWLLALSRRLEERPPAELEGTRMDVYRDLMIAADARVAPSVVSEGPVIIGPGCEVRPGAYLRGPVILAGSNVVGHGTEVKASLLFRGATASHLSYIGDSFVGGGTILGAGSVLGNRRLDGRTIRIEGVATNRQLFGSFIGDGCVVGCNAVINPGSIVAMGSLIPPLTSVVGRWPQRASSQ